MQQASQTMEVFLIPPLDVNVVNNPVSYTDVSSFIKYTHFFQRHSLTKHFQETAVYKHLRKDHSQAAFIRHTRQTLRYRIHCCCIHNLTVKNRTRKTSQNRFMVANTAKTISTLLLPITGGATSILWQRKQRNWNCTPNSLHLKTTEANFVLWGSNSKQ